MGERWSIAVTAVLLVTLASAILTGVFRRLAVGKGMLDVPNHRSSHRVPVPRGGGIVFVFLSITAMVGVTFLLPVPAGPWGIMAIGGAGVGLVGWLDDRSELEWWKRLLVHWVVGLMLVFAVGGLPEIRWGKLALELGLWGGVFGTLLVIWSINLYNFMDGIDGLAAANGVAVALTAGFLNWRAAEPALALLSLVLAGSLAGFLVWNWPPAKLFMGDVGSGFLGFAFVALAILSETGGGAPLLIWLLLMLPFMVDATLTLLGRLFKGEEWLKPHRSHLYQRAVLRGYGHLKVTLAYLALEITVAIEAILLWPRPEFLPLAFLLTTLFLSGGWWFLMRRFVDMEDSAQW